MYALIARLRSVTTPSALGRANVPGAVSHHELGSARVHFRGGASAQVSFLASRLEYSRWLEVSIVLNRGIELLLRTLVDHFAKMGGVPLLSVLRVPKRVPLRIRSSAGHEWHPALAHAALDLGVGVVVPSPHDGTLFSEPLARWVKNRFFERRRFADVSDVQSQLSIWVRDVNTKIPSRSTRAVPAKRMSDDEHAYLRPLLTGPREFALRVPAVVGPQANVVYEGVAYGVPRDTLGMLATVRVERTRLRIVIGRRYIDHDRRGGPGM
jgi:hypothetical protein